MGLVTARTTRQTVTFHHPVRIEGIEEILPAGGYEVETDEESIDFLSFVAWRRIRATVMVQTKGTLRAYAVNPSDLDASIKRDAQGL
jgi:hypothetical protein